MKRITTALLCTFWVGLLADCPKDTAVVKLSRNAAYKAVTPFSLPSMTKAKAAKSAFGITVFISNADFDAKAAAKDLSKSPVSAKGQVSLALTFMNASKPVLKGEYAVKANVFDPMNVRGDLGFGQDKGAPVVYGMMLKSGKATLLEATDQRVCGTFELQGPDGPVSGRFTALMSK